MVTKLSLELSTARQGHGRELQPCLGQRSAGGMTIIAADSFGQTVDLRMLRSFRVLRPLKLVSRLPRRGQAGARGPGGAALGIWRLACPRVAPWRPPPHCSCCCCYYCCCCCCGLVLVGSSRPR
ncbi:hypothetical protein E2C01_053446 [Portunus trituberculatus]|uniref:Uncharacterized protein n=1 Tax=Portunus trituberculatus TaxID=210409 RepID=A0A5B7GQB5_PORTR|nr:hypothetical protein [Portunus trituberculatus]